MAREISDRTIVLRPEHISMSSSLLDQLMAELRRIPEFQTEASQAILEREMGTVEASRYDGRRVLRFTRGADAVSALVEVRKGSSAERQKTLTLSPSARGSRLPMFEYEEAETTNPHDIPRRKMILHAGPDAFERGKGFIEHEVKKFREKS